MTRCLIVFCLWGALLGCEGEREPANDTAAEADTATEADGDLAPSVCDVAFENGPTCEDLVSALSDAQAWARKCSTHEECFVGNDPLCGNDGGYPFTSSSAQDQSQASCILEAYWAAGCQGESCDWWAPIPKAACYSGVCTLLKTGCQADADCGSDQVCRIDEDASGPTNTYCELSP